MCAVCVNPCCFDDVRAAYCVCASVVYKSTCICKRVPYLRKRAVLCTSGRSYDVSASVCACLMYYRMFAYMFGKNPDLKKL